MRRNATGGDGEHAAAASRRLMELLRRPDRVAREARRLKWFRCVFSVVSQLVPSPAMLHFLSGPRSVFTLRDDFDWCPAVCNYLMCFSVLFGVRCSLRVHRKFGSKPVVSTCLVKANICGVFTK